MRCFYATVLTILIALLIAASADSAILKESYSSGCSGALTNSSGSFSNPVIISEPEKYPDNTYCKWSIKVPRGGNVTISFTKFHTEACCDYVKITSEKGSVIGQYSGPLSSFKVTVKRKKAKKINIVFKSDETVYKTGFHANYRVYGKFATSVDPTTPPVATQVNGVGDSLMEAFLKLTTALTRIVQSASHNLGRDSNGDNLLRYKSDLYQVIQILKSMRSVQSPALTNDEEEQLNLVLKHLNVASKKATKRLSVRLSPAACFLPKRVGPCRAAFRRWYFNNKLNRCRTFIYGGCQKNANNFLTKGDCQSLCEPKKAECPDDRPLVNCFANPCEVQSCNAYPSSRCVPNFCGGCNAEFYDQYNNTITDQCSCHKGQRPVQCPVDPCQVSNCPLHPQAKCRSRICGSCHAEFIDEYGIVLADCPGPNKSAGNRLQ